MEKLQHSGKTVHGSDSFEDKELRKRSFEEKKGRERSSAGRQQQHPNRIKRRSNGM